MYYILSKIKSTNFTTQVTVQNNVFGATYNGPQALETNKYKQ